MTHPERTRDDPAGSAAMGGRVGVVTGGEHGSGLALVAALAEQGMRVVMATGAPDVGRAALDDLGELADRVAVRHLDLTDQTGLSRLVATLERQLGRCDALVHHTAVVTEDVQGSVDVVRRRIESSLVQTWQLAQAFAPLMRRHGHGRVVTVTNHAGDRAWRAAVRALTRALATDLAGHGVLVNAVDSRPAARRRRGKRVSGAGVVDTVLWLVSLPDDGPTGHVFRPGSGPSAG